MASNDKPVFSAYPTVYLPVAPIRTYIYEPDLIPNIYSSDVIISGYDRSIRNRKYLEFLESERLYKERLREKVDDQIYKYEVQRRVEKELDRQYIEREVRRSVLDLHSRCRSCCCDSARVRYCCSKCQDYQCKYRSCDRIKCCNHC
jgi:hypothetical protein